MRHDTDEGTTEEHSPWGARDGFGARGAVAYWGSRGPVAFLAGRPWGANDGFGSLAPVALWEARGPVAVLGGRAWGANDGFGPRPPVAFWEDRNPVACSGVVGLELHMIYWEAMVQKDSCPLPPTLRAIHSPPSAVTC